MINLSKNEQQLTDEIMGKINLSKDKNNLESHVINLSKSIVNLSKKSEIDIGDKKARVVVVLDYSGSMRKLYNNGTVQQTLNKLVPLGLKFDDNGTIDVYAFRDDCIPLEDLSINNYDSYVVKEITSKIDKYGRTVYSPVLYDILHKMCKIGLINNIIRFIKSIFKIKEKDNDTIYVMFITDGGNEDGDNVNCDNAIKELSKHKAFIQFIGIGDNKFKYFNRLPKIKNRASNNTGSAIIKDLENVSDNELYDKLLGDFSKWLKEVED